VFLENYLIVHGAKWFVLLIFPLLFEITFNEIMMVAMKELTVNKQLITRDEDVQGWRIGQDSGTLPEIEVDLLAEFMENFGGLLLLFISLH
jgi:hypothetical protein